MGIYLETSEPLDKAAQLAARWGGEVLETPPPFAKLQAAGKVVIAVVRNEDFEAAGICYNECEYGRFTEWDDMRPCLFVVLLKERAFEAFMTTSDNAAVIARRIEEGRSVAHREDVEAGRVKMLRQHLLGASSNSPARTDD